MRRTILLIVISALLFSCSNKQDFESIVKRYIKDSMFTTLNYPSYRYISMQADTITGSKLDKQYFEFHTEVVEYLKKHAESSELKNIKDTTGLAEYIKQFDDRKEHPLKPDSIFQINVHVKYSLYELGTIIVRKLHLIYHPKEKKFIVEKAL